MSLLKVRQSIAAVRTPVTWDPIAVASGGELDANIALSAANLTATMSGSADKGVSAWFGRKTGKWYYEILTGGTWTGGDTGIGYLKALASHANFGSNGTLGCGFFVSGTCWTGSAQGSTGLGSIGTAQVVGMYADLDNNLNWCTKDGASFSFSGNPTSGTNGKTGGWTTGDLVKPAVCFGASSAAVCTIRLRKSEFTLTIASGFLPWQP